jgi:hypothetical protein
VVATEADILAGMPESAALAEDYVAGNDIFVCVRELVSCAWRAQEEDDRVGKVIIGDDKMSQNVPPVFFAPNRFPGPFLGPLARPAVPCEACLTEIVLEGFVGRNRAQAASRMTGRDDWERYRELVVARATALCRANSMAVWCVIMGSFQDFEADLNR